MAEKHTADSNEGISGSSLEVKNNPSNSPSRNDSHNRKLWTRSQARKWTIMLFIASCFLYCARMAMPICAVKMAATFQWSKIDSGIVLGGFFWGYCLTQILGGYASDRVGGERVLFISALSWTLITIVTPLLVHLGSRTLVLMTMARFLMGLFQGVFFPSLASLCSQRVTENERGFMMSTLHSGVTLGTLLAGAIGSLLLERYGWESVFYCTGFLSSLWTIAAWLFLIKGEVVLTQMETATQSQWHLSQTHWLNLFKKPSIWAMVFAHLCMCGTGYILLSWLPTYFKETFPHATAWIYNIVPWLVAIPSALIGGIFSDFLISRGHSVAFVRKTTQFVAMGVSSVFIIYLTGNVTFPTAVTFVSIYVCLTTFTSSGVSVNVQDLTPSCAGALYGFMNMMGAFSGLVFVSLSGYLIEVTQSWAVIFSLITFLNTLGLVVFLIFGDAIRVDVDEHTPVLAC
ncbi:solute carrier family 17 member 9-like [Gouania willdenowi]|uniref:Voltage-gated purine nucleotide uniporter SLC17A9 n=1 Tax=Gouania willdenowi TaxID=441366 RepID=A0A8C5ELT2_GOUWI|nr:solute carrier family 17 member 9-like [Gouania willdenowi]